MCYEWSNVHWVPCINSWPLSLHVYILFGSSLTLLCGFRVVGLHCIMLPAVGRWRQSECWYRSSSLTQTHLTRQVALGYLNDVPLSHNEERSLAAMQWVNPLRPVSPSLPLHSCNSEGLSVNSYIFIHGSVSFKLIDNVTCCCPILCYCSLATHQWTLPCQVEMTHLF